MRSIHSILFSFFILSTIVSLGQSGRSIDSLKIILQNENQNTKRIAILNKLAFKYQNINRDSSIYFLNQSLQLARELDDPKHKSYVYTRLGSNYCFKGEYLKALEYLDLAENINLEFTDKKIEAEICYYKSLIFLHLDKYQQANEKASCALKLYIELNMTGKVRGVYTIFCYIFEELNDFEKSLEYSLKSYKISQTLGDSINIAADLNNVGTRYLLLNQNDSALTYVRKAILLNKNYNNQVWLAINYHNMADIFLSKKDVDSADYYIEKAEVIYNNIGHLINYYLTIEVHARISLARKDTLSAIEYYKMIIDSPRHFENLKIKTIAYEALYKIAFNKKDFIAADNYFRSYKLFDDSLNNETNTSLLSVLELQMAYEKHRNNLELENKEVKLRLNKKNYYITILAGIVALLVLVIYFIYRLQKARAKVIQAENKRIEQELEFKKREMTTNVMSLMKKNEILTELSRSLLELEKTALKSETKNALNKIAQKIRKTRDEEISEEFNIRFKEVHSEFYTNLLQQYPDLTPSEQRLCALLRMNMSTKEISELIGNNPSSIDNARSKIRKKFGIPGDVNLISFLSSF